VGEDASCTFVLGFKMTTGGVGYIFKFGLELAIVLGFVADLNGIVLKDVLFVVDLTV
jgi:hypothetical protein